MGVVLLDPVVPGQQARVDPGGNLAVAEGLKGYSVGGEYITAGWTTAVVPAALAANTNLAAMRFAVASSRKAYITKIRLLVVPSTLGAAAGVAGVLGWQRFTAQTPTGGAQRVAAKKNASHPSNSDMTDIRDSNAALTGTAPTWGDIVGVSQVPLFITSGPMWFEWIYEPDDEPIVLAAGDGLGLRTQMAMAATQTWLYSYTVHWYEK